MNNFEQCDWNWFVEYPHWTGLKLIFRFNKIGKNFRLKKYHLQRIQYEKFHSLQHVANKFTMDRLMVH